MCEEDYWLEMSNQAELETTLHQVEYIVNSRPLTVVHDVELNDVEPLTPNHFLLGYGGGNDVSNENAENVHNDALFQPTSNEMLKQLMKSKSVQLEKFWLMWHNTYLCNLPLLQRSG